MEIVDSCKNSAYPFLTPCGNFKAERKCQLSFYYLSCRLPRHHGPVLMQMTRLCSATACNNTCLTRLLSPSLSISMDENQKHSFVLPTPVDLINNNMASIFSPFYSLLTPTSESYHHDQETKDNVPSQIAYGSIVLLKKLGLCFLSAAYVCMILFLVLILAFVVGVGLVRFWVEEPLIVHESLHFDYTETNPSAVFSFSGEVSAAGGYVKTKHIRVPVGHTFSVSLSLLMPESDFNRELGVFQVCLFVSQISLYYTREL